MNGLLSVRSDEAGFDVFTLTGPKIDLETLQALERAFQNASRPVLLCNSGEDFCLGRAPGGRPENEAEAREMVIDPILAVYAAMRSMGAPIVAAVRGRAFGLGFALAAASDFVVADADAQFSLPEINAGFAPLLAITQVKRILPEPIMIRMAATGSVVGAQQLFNWGAISEIVDAFQDVGAAAKNLLADICRRPPVATLKAHLAAEDWARRHADAEAAAVRLASALVGKG